MNMEIPGSDSPSRWWADLMYMAIGNIAHILRYLKDIIISTVPSLPITSWSRDRESIFDIYPTQVDK